MEEMIKDYMYVITEYSHSDLILEINTSDGFISVKWEDTFYGNTKTTKFTTLDLLAWVYSQIPVITNR